MARKLTPELRQLKRMFWFAEHNWDSYLAWSQNKRFKTRADAANGALAFGIFDEGFGGLDVPISPEQALPRMFGGFNLDPQNPFAWRFLLGILAFGFLGKIPTKAFARRGAAKKSRGRPKGQSERTTIRNRVLELGEGVPAWQALTTRQKADILQNFETFKGVSRLSLERLIQQSAKGRDKIIKKRNSL
jgi:hypothetical protein